MIINTNISSLTAQENATNTNSAISASLEKLSSGLKINKASDDASGLAIADKLRTQATSINQAVDNGNSAVTLLQIADKSMAEQSNILDIVKAKLIQANTSTTSEDGREAIREDISKLLEQLDNIAEQTNYNGNSLLQASSTSTYSSSELSFQIGENSSDMMSTDFIKSNTIGLGGADVALVQTSGSLTQNNIAADGEAVFINSNKAFDLDNDDIINNSDIDNLTISGQTTGSPAVSAAMGIVNLSADAIDTISTTSGSTISVIFDDSTTLAVNNKINAGAAGFSSTDITYDIDTNQFSIHTSGSFSMKDLGKIGSITIDGSSLENITISGEVSNLSIGNTEDTKFAGGDTSSETANNQLKVTSDSTSGVTGGQTLANLANLGSNELTADKAAQFQEVVNNSITILNSYRASIGSTQNQVESAVRNLMTQATNVTAAESIIRDVDYAEESAEFNKQNIISQAGSYAIGQANTVAQNVLKLLQ